jgi:uroporphyrinogen decarboxylase
MDRLCDVHVENTRRFMQAAAAQVDMVYFYDDVATSQSLLVPPDTWRQLIRPRHARLVEVARRFGAKVMYHCDGAIAPLIPELLDMGIDVLNPIQTDAPGMDPAALKRDFGRRLCFHGGVSIVEVLPKGTPQSVAAEVTRLRELLNTGGGYILASSHHIQADTPIDNILAMYDVKLR